MWSMRKAKLKYCWDRQSRKAKAETEASLASVFRESYEKTFDLSLYKDEEEANAARYIIVETLRHSIPCGTKKAERLLSA